jgi:hypothetical protein
MWQYGLVMNVHLTISWRLLGVMNHAWAVKLYKHEAAKWLDVGIGDGVERVGFRAGPRGRVRSTCSCIRTTSGSASPAKGEVDHSTVSARVDRCVDGVRLPNGK